MAEAHEAGFAVFCVLNEPTPVVPVRMNFLEHADNGGVRASVQRAPEGANAGGHRREQIRATAPDHADRRGGAILLVVSVQEKKQVESIRHLGLDLERLVRLGEHEVHEVFDVAKIAARVIDRQPTGHAISHRRDGAHLRNEEGGGFIERREITLPIIRGEIGIVAAQGVEHRAHDGHRMAVVRESLEMVFEIFVQTGVGADFRPEGVELFACREFAVDDQVSGTEKRRFFCQLLDRYPPVAQNAFFTIDEGDVAETGARIAVALVKGDIPRICAQFAGINRLLPLRTRDDRVGMGFSLDDDFSLLAGGS